MATLSDKERQRDHWRHLMNNRDARVDELQREKKQAEAQIRELIERRKEKREDNPELGDAIADEIEELKTYAKRLENRAAEKRDEKKFFANKFRQAKKAVNEARKNLRSGQLSPNFHVSEFHCRDGTPVPKAAIPALKAWCVEYGEPMRKKFGAVHVNSGYRTRSYNASIGGASNSIHIYDAHPGAVAVDITCASGTPSQWADYGDSLGVDGLGRYSTFVHFDNRNRIGWATSRWSG
jgi:hypothetical protein